MVQKVAGTPITPDGVVSLQWLAEGRDGLYRPTAGVYREKVRTPVAPRQCGRGSREATGRCTLLWMRRLWQHGHPAAAAVGSSLCCRRRPSQPHDPSGTCCLSLSLNVRTAACMPLADDFDHWKSHI